MNGEYNPSIADDKTRPASGEYNSSIADENARPMYSDYNSSMAENNFQSGGIWIEISVREGRMPIITTERLDQRRFNRTVASADLVSVSATPDRRVTIIKEWWIVAPGTFVRLRMGIHIRWINRSRIVVMTRWSPLTRVRKVQQVRSLARREGSTPLGKVSRSTRNSDCRGTATWDSKSIRMFPSKPRTMTSFNRSSDIARAWITGRISQLFMKPTHVIWHRLTRMLPIRDTALIWLSNKCEEHISGWRGSRLEIWTQSKYEL